MNGPRWDVRAKKKGQPWGCPLCRPIERRAFWPMVRRGVLASFDESSTPEPAVGLRLTPDLSPYHGYAASCCAILRGWTASGLRFRCDVDLNFDIFAEHISEHRGTMDAEIFAFERRAAFPPREG